MNEQRADEVVGTYGGDAFGNGDMTMLRCRQCTGLYIKAPDLLKPTIMGLLLIDDGGRGRRQRESTLAEIYAQGPKCRCSKTEDDDVNWPEWRAIRITRPPMHEREWEENFGHPGRPFIWGMSTELPNGEEGTSEEGSG